MRRDFEMNLLSIKFHIFSEFKWILDIFLDFSLISFQ